MSQCFWAQLSVAALVRTYEDHVALRCALQQEGPELEVARQDVLRW